MCHTTDLTYFVWEFTFTALILILLILTMFTIFGLKTKKFNIIFTVLKTGLFYVTFQPPLPLNGNLRNTSYMKQIPNYEL